MGLRIRIIRYVIAWLWRHYQFLLREQVVPGNAHIHRNPVKKADVKESIVKQYPTAYGSLAENQKAGG